MREEFAGKSGTLVPAGTNISFSTVGHVAAVGVPAGVHDSTVQLDKPALGVSRSTEVAPLAGPALVNVTV